MAKKKKKKAPGSANQPAKKPDSAPPKKADSAPAAKVSPPRKTYKTRQAEAKTRARRKMITVVVAGIVIVGAALSLPWLLASDEIGVTDSTAWDLPALEGQGPIPADGRLQLADYAGTPLVLNFFASWCTACEAELPRFRAAGEALDGLVEVVFVNSNETGNWKPMAERTGIIDQPLMRDINGSNGNGLYRSLGGTGGMPLTAFFDADGNVLHVDPGELSGATLLARLQEFYPEVYSPST